MSDWMQEHAVSHDRPKKAKESKAKVVAQPDRTSTGYGSDQGAIKRLDPVPEETRQPVPRVSSR